MGIKLDELIEAVKLNADDIMHLRTVEGLDKKIAVDNMPAADLAGSGRTTETVKDNADDVASHEADNITPANTVHGIRQGSGNNFDADKLDGAHKDIDGTLGGNSDLSVPTEKAVKTYVDGAVGSPLGVAKAWVNFNGTGTVAIRDSFNVSSITDNGTALYAINFTNNMSDVNYVVAGMGSIITTDGRIQAEYPNARTVSTFSLYTTRFDGIPVDSTYISLIVFGS